MMKTLLKTASVLMLMALMVVVHGNRRSFGRRSQIDPRNLDNCRNSPRIRQDEKEEERRRLECPARAICGDEWNTIRDWYNGTACRDHRITYNCRCPGDTMCPIGDDNYVFYANKKQRQYTCEPKCNLRRCTTRLMASVEMVQYSPDFNGHNYYRINCRCPGHDYPMDTRRGRLSRATSYSRLRFNFTAGIVYSQYRCSSRISLSNPDVCDSLM